MHGNARHSPSTPAAGKRWLLLLQLMAMATRSDWAVGRLLLLLLLLAAGAVAPEGGLFSRRGVGGYARSLRRVAVGYLFDSFSTMERSGPHER